MKKAILFLVTLSLIGCVSLNGYKEKIKIPKNTFVAKYYDGDKFIASEVVDRISIHYGYNSFHGINSRSFRAVWEGEIDGGTEGKNITMSFYDSHSSRSVYVDNKKMTAWSKNNKYTTEFIEPGTHKIRIELLNRWHTTNFTASFDNYPAVNKNSSKKSFLDGIAPQTKVAYIGAYESDDIYNRATISIPKINTRPQRGRY